MPSRPSSRRHVIFVFLDGVGIGPAPQNPFLAASMPFLDSLLDSRRPNLQHPCITTDRAAAFPVDATLGVDGRPQSATGQAAIVTGRNVPGLLGEHYGPKPDSRIRQILDDGTLFSHLIRHRVSVASANAYPPPYFEGIRSGRRLLSVIPYALSGAGVALNDLAAYRRGEAVSGTITGQDWQDKLGIPDVPVHTPEAAGQLVGRRARTSSLVFFEHWITDIHGHKRMFREAVSNFARIDRFLAGLTATIDLDRTLVIVGSDHGNVEDCSHGRHTGNPALGLMWGAGFRLASRRINALGDFRSVIEDCLL